jgi:hypothetical protein
LRALIIRRAKPVGRKLLEGLSKRERTKGSPCSYGVGVGRKANHLTWEKTYRNLKMDYRCVISGKNRGRLRAVRTMKQDAENYLRELKVKILVQKTNNSTGSSKKNAGIIKICHSKTVKHIEMIQVLKC